jgi:hypothetical protein
MLRTPVLAQLLMQRADRGPDDRGRRVLLLDSRAPGRGLEAIEWGQLKGMLSRIPAAGDEPATLAALGAPETLAG